MASDLNIYANANGSTFRPLDVQAWDSTTHGSHWGQLAQAPHAYEQQQWPSQSSQQSSRYQYSTTQGYGSNAGDATAPTSQSTVTQSYAQTSAQSSTYRHGSYSTYLPNGAHLSAASSLQDSARNVTTALSQGSTGDHVGQGSRGNQSYRRHSSNPTLDQDHQDNRTAAPPAHYQTTYQTGNNAASTNSEVPQSINPSQISLGRPPTQQAPPSTQSSSLPQLGHNDHRTDRQSSLNRDAALSTSTAPSLHAAARQGSQHKRKRTAEKSPVQDASQRNRAAQRFPDPNGHVDEARRNTNTTIHSNAAASRVAGEELLQGSSLAGKQHDQRPVSVTGRSQPAGNQRDGDLSAEQIRALQGVGQRGAHTESEPAAQDKNDAEPTTQQTQDQQDSPVDGRPPPAAPVGRWSMTAAGLQDNFARPQISLPPVIGAHLHYSNIKVKYNPVPEKLDEIRNKLFLVKEPVLLNSQQIADYWPHMSNVWHRSMRKEEHYNGTSTETWECRQKRRTIPRARPERESGSRLRVSKKQMIEGVDPCKLKLTVVHYTKHADTEENHHIGFGACKCLPEWLYIRRTDRTWDRSHNHDLDQLDKYKHSDGIMYFAQNKVEEGYSFSAVANWLHEKYGEVTSQAQFITKQDVANVAQKWRQYNRDIVLKTVVEEPTAEENEQKRCQDLINSTTPQGLMKALAAICQSIPSAIPIALPVLEAMQQKRTDDAGEVVDVGSMQSGIKEGVDIVAPPPGIPWKTFQRPKFVPPGFEPPETSPPKLSAVAVSHAAARSAAGLKWTTAGSAGPSMLASQGPATNVQVSQSGVQGIVMYIAPTLPPAAPKPADAPIHSHIPRQQIQGQAPAPTTPKARRQDIAPSHALAQPSRAWRAGSSPIHPQQAPYRLPTPEAPACAGNSRQSENWTPSWLRPIDAGKAPARAPNRQKDKAAMQINDPTAIDPSLAVEQQLQAELNATT
ncbi:hypothetical protein EJ03DRAFT_324011 [Teratosphaeria nubilosa]|uniref:Uncharacterized protein n=1 Tax=Teratosphaeria nubilosa TaxID=161662 RepID=A0A6G1LJ16_9PEZI|nr:hypothetical protein EJ03DRAFT_324011 [Teratosphaeria nubilosa]